MATSNIEFHVFKDRIEFTGFVNDTALDEASLRLQDREADLFAKHAPIYEGHSLHHNEMKITLYTRPIEPEISLPLDQIQPIIDAAMRIFSLKSSNFFSSLYRD